MGGLANFITVLGKTGPQVSEDINEFVEQFEAAKRNLHSPIDEGLGDGAQLGKSEQDARKAAAECLDVFANVRDSVRSAFDVTNLREYPEGRIIEEAEEALRRIVQTQPIDCAKGRNKKSLNTAEASGLIIRCRKYWRENTDHPLDLGTKPSPKPYGEFLEFVSHQFELESNALFDRELEIREREQALKERVKTQPSQPSDDF